jgi:hypothetical protein
MLKFGSTLGPPRPLDGPTRGLHTLRQHQIHMQALDRSMELFMVHGEFPLLKWYSVRVDFAGREFQNG